MDRKEYKQAFDRERYERIELKVPKGMKSIIKLNNPGSVSLLSGLRKP